MEIEQLRRQMNELMDEVVQLRLKVAELEKSGLKPHETISPAAQVTPPSKKKGDLKGMIGLNDRFRFLNELFGGNSGEFNAAINQLDEIESMEEADDYLDRLFGIYHWDKKGQAYTDFYSLVKQKITH